MKSVIAALYKKEILDILRDKKTVIVMILIPLILYPLLMFGSMAAAAMIVSNQEEATYRVALEVEDVAPILEEMKQQEKELGYKFETVEVDNWEEALDKDEIDIAVTEKKRGEQLQYEIQYLASSTASNTAADHMEEVLEAYGDSLREQKVRDAGLDVEGVLYPVTTEQINRSSSQESVGSIIGSLLPFLMITSILMGAVYPAIDTTAGEKERGTLETLLTLPVTNFQLIFSKFLAVSTMASVSALLNFLSVGIYGYFMLQSLPGESFGNLSVDLVQFVPAILLMLLCVLVFAMLMSALCLCICIFAKSFKEAQNYTTPLLLAVMLVGYIGFLPNVSLNQVYAVVPVANIVLLVKKIFLFQYDFHLLFLVLFSNIAYSIFAILFLSKVYNSESILFEEGGSVHLFESRKNIKKGQIPGIGDAFLLMAISLLILFFVSGVAINKLGFGGLAVEQGLFLVSTLGFAWYMKVDGKCLFSLRLPGIRAFFGSIVLFLGTYGVMHILQNALQSVFHESASGVEQMSELFGNPPFWQMVLLVAVLPAICEELLFRGFLFGTMREHWRVGTAILTSGILFGVFHMSFVKAIVISLMGIAFAYIVHCTKSIFYTMFLHFCNNLFSVICLSYPEQIAEKIPALAGETLSPQLIVVFLGVAVIGIPLGVELLRKE